MQTRDVAAARSTRPVADRTMGTGALDRVSSGVLEAGRDVSGSGAGMWRKSISCTQAGIMIIGSAGLIVLGLRGYRSPECRVALALIFGFGAAIAWPWDELR
jgi:hypothetical protein